ncbi:hypothetical protein GCM10025784_12440 [Citricoccus nitrophenolicus]
MARSNKRVVHLHTGSPEYARVYGSPVRAHRALERQTKPGDDIRDYNFHDLDQPTGTRASKVISNVKNRFPNRPDCSWCRKRKATAGSKKNPLCDECARLHGLVTAADQATRSAKNRSLTPSQQRKLAKRIVDATEAEAKLRERRAKKRRKGPKTCPRCRTQIPLSGRCDQCVD